MNLEYEKKNPDENLPFLEQWVQQNICYCEIPHLRGQEKWQLKLTSESAERLWAQNIWVWVIVSCVPS